MKVRTLNGQVGLGRLDAAGQSTLRPQGLPQDW